MYRHNRTHRHQPIHHNSCDLSAVSRAALILYTNDSDTTYVLLGKGSNGLTTLGGRTQHREVWLNCLIRELQEETRGLLDYSNHPEIFLTKPAQIIESSNCAYVFFPSTLDSLKRIAKKFPETSSDRLVCNEMLSLEIVSVDTLIIDRITTRSIPCAPMFETMFLNIGYDTLKGNTCNYTTANVSIEADMFQPIGSLPSIICLTPIDHGLPVVYGFSPSQGLFITDQFYLEEKGRRLFRSGWKSIEQ